LREPAAISLREIIDAVTSALPSPDDYRLVIFGHSMGAIVAFEVARQLRREGRALPAVLMVSGCAAPHLPGRAPRIAHLPASEVFGIMAERHGGIPDAILNDPELVELMGGTLKADLTIMEAYEASLEEPLACPIVALGGLEDAWTSQMELSAWSTHTTDEFSLEQFPGGHFYFRQPEVLATLLGRIREITLSE
jgi:medium-chain acyl-[acyl-carrier-protein] hydrolase